MSITKRDEKGRIAKGSNLKHGLSNHPLYDCWVAMKARCLNRQHPCYNLYGGRGITVCKEWKESFEAFFKYLGHKPAPGLTIERIDVNKGYEPGNVKWATVHEQQRNRRNNNAFVGVYFDEKRNKWRADIRISGKKIFLGRFNEEKDARAARKSAEEKYAV